MNREYLDQYRLNSAALFYRNIFELANIADEETLEDVLNGLEILTCSGVVLCPGMSFKLDEFSSPRLFNEKLINYVKEIKKVYIEYNGIIIPLSSNSYETRDTIVETSNIIVQAVASVFFGEDVDIYVRPKMIDYISENDYEWNFDHYSKTLEQISEIIDSIVKRLSKKKELIPNDEKQ